MDNRSLFFSLVVGVVVTICFITEIMYNKNIGVTQIVSETLRELSPDDTSDYTDRHFVYMHSKDIKYDPIIDPDFQVTVNAAYLERKVEYCQWTEVKEKGKEDSYKNSYIKKWTDEQVDSLMFQDPTDHVNPKRPDIEKKSFNGYAKADEYYIDSSLIDPSNTSHYVPAPQELVPFTSSSMQTIFRYIGDGWFYSPFSPPGTTDSTPMRIFTRFFSGLTNGELEPAELARVFNDCYPGDVRVQFRVWRPSEISLIGYRKGLIIKKHTYDNVDIGRAVHGFKNKDEIFKIVNSSLKRTVFIMRMVLLTASIFVYWNERSAARFIPAFFLFFLLIAMGIPDIGSIFHDTKTVYFFGIMTGAISGLIFYVISRHPATLYGD